MRHEKKKEREHSRSREWKEMRCLKGGRDDYLGKQCCSLSQKKMERGKKKYEIRSKRRVSCIYASSLFLLIIGGANSTSKPFVKITVSPVSQGRHRRREGYYQERWHGEGLASFKQSNWALARSRGGPINRRSFLVLSTSVRTLRRSSTFLVTLEQ